MIVVAIGLVGAVYGGFLAKRRKGNAYDIAQYAAGFGLAFACAGLFVALFLNRMM